MRHVAYHNEFAKMRKPNFVCAEKKADIFSPRDEAMSACKTIILPGHC
jgi:hypothetical protein